MGILAGLFFLGMSTFIIWAIFFAKTQKKEEISKPPFVGASASFVPTQVYNAGSYLVIDDKNNKIGFVVGNTHHHGSCGVSSFEG